MAMKLFFDAHCRRKSNVETCNAAVSAGMQGQQWQLSMSVLKMAHQNGLRLDAVSYGAAMTAAWRCALELSSAMCHAGLDLKLIHCNSIMSIALQIGQWEITLQCMRDLHTKSHLHGW